VVCKLVNPQNHTTPTGQVVKIVTKKPITSVFGVSSMKREISVWQTLSSLEYRHPNVTKLYDIYHTETHILFRMEHGGKCNLYKRLVLREDKVALGARKTIDILSQCMAAICHLHMNPQIVHRDLKPENIIVSEQTDAIKIQLSDFDTALFAYPGETLCKGVIGTFPFMAEPVVGGGWYDPFPADIWSMGVVCLELLCRPNILKKLVNFVEEKSSRHHERRVTQSIHRYFEKPNIATQVVKEHINPEVSVHMQDAQTLVDAMLNVSLEKRWTARDMLEASTRLFVAS
jgi:serine/threonine protein kinase